MDEGRPRNRPPLRLAPVPLVDRDRQVIVIWSPKSACTTTYVWFSHLCGFGHELDDYRGRVHAHHLHVYRKSSRYSASVAADTGGYHVVRIIRDPYIRAVSIFRYALITHYADSSLAEAGLDFEKGISFRTFLEFLARIDMRRANIHYRPQLHPLERERKPDTVINITKSDMFAALNALEARMNWPHTDFPGMAWLHEYEGGRKARSDPFDGADLDLLPLVRSRRIRHSPFPTYDQLLTPAARRDIEAIYAADFEAYRDYL